MILQCKLIAKTDPVAFQAAVNTALAEIHKNPNCGTSDIQFSATDMGFCALITYHQWERENANEKVDTNGN